MHEKEYEKISAVLRMMKIDFARADADVFRQELNDF
jgi:hypothetical protein